MPPRPAKAASSGDDDGHGLSPAQMEAAAAALEENPEVDKATDINWKFKALVETMIVVNAIQLGVCVDPDASSQVLEFCSLSENVFLSIFFIEVIFRIYMQGTDYFRWRWNQFDFILTSMAIVDNWIMAPLLQFTNSPFSNVYVFRLMRLLRILRILKFLRTKKELQMLMEGLMGAMRSMVWVSMLLGFLIYTVAIICVTLFSKVKPDYPLTFNSMPEAIFTLFTLAIVADWTEIVMPVVQEYPWAALGFGMFTTVATFGILNLIIGVITERTTKVQLEYEAFEQYSKDLTRMKSIEEIAHIIFDTQEDGTITQEELEEMMSHEEHGPKIRDIVANVQLPEGFTILDCHPMFDRDASGSITRDEFIQGMKRLIFSNSFQRSCIMQSAIADVLVEIKCVEDRLSHLINKEVDTVRQDVKLAIGSSGGGGDGGAAKVAGGEATEGGSPNEAGRSLSTEGHTKPTAAKPADEKPVEAATAALQLPKAGLSVHEAMRHHKEFKVMSSKLLVRLREPMLQLLTEGLQAEVWADINPSSIASGLPSSIAADLERTSHHAHRVPRGAARALSSERHSASGPAHFDIGVFATEVPNESLLETTASSADAGSKGNMRSARPQASGSKTPIPPRLREINRQRSFTDFGAPLSGASPSTGSAWSLENTMGQHFGAESASGDVVNAGRSVPSNSSQAGLGGQAVRSG